MAVFQSLAPLGAGQQASSEPGMVTVDPGIPVTDWHGGDHDVLTSVWRSQPAVRKVLDYKARQIASVPLHAYLRVEGGRERDRSSEVARMLGNPTGPGSTAYRLWHAVMLDKLIHDRFCVAKMASPVDGSLWLQRIPPRLWRFRTNQFDQPVEVRVVDDRGEGRRFPLDRFILDVGYAQGGGNGTSSVLTLSDLLRELRESVAWRRNMWDRGARVSHVVKRERPWSSEQARSRFQQEWREFSTGGARAGGTALLEDGMSVEKMDAWSPTDVQDLEGRRLTDIEVASFFHVPPEMVGARQGNYANMDAFRQSLWRDTLGPDITSWEQAVNSGLADRMPDGGYVEAHVEAKLRGSFIEQSKVLSTSTGAPWLLRSEARERMNLPPIAGGDELVVPLNVLAGGQASPQDSGTQNTRSASLPVAKAGRPAGVKAGPTAPQVEQARRVLQAFFTRQGAAVLSAVGAGEAWRDPDRWDAELTTDVLRLYSLVAGGAGMKTLAELGFDPADYDEDRTVAFLTEAAGRSARSINQVTFDQVEQALAADEDLVEVVDWAKSARAVSAARGVVGFAAGFGTVEAGRQISRDTTKTWLVTSTSPRASHAAMDGETVPVGEPFSNGMDWPGSSGSADEVAGCRCEVMISTPA